MDEQNISYNHVTICKEIRQSARPTKQTPIFESVKATSNCHDPSWGFWIARMCQHQPQQYIALDYMLPYLNNTKIVTFLCLIVIFKTDN